MQVDSVTYSMAQQVRWLDDTHVLVGRWDGTIGVFSAPVEDGARAILETSLVLPGATGVQLLVPRTSHEFVSSGGPDHLWMWRADAGADRTDFVPHELSFPVEAGVAVSGLFTRIGEQELLVTGHENGALLVWEWEESGVPRLRQTVDLRMAEPIDYAHADEPLRHIRGLAMWRDGIVVAGGEDGGLHQVRLADGAILSQRLFNPEARLGINDLAVHGDHVLVVNCAIDKRDRNLWLFSLQADRTEHVDAANLLLDERRKRIFAFDVVTWHDEGGPMAAVTTKEGLVWRVKFADGVIEPIGQTALGRFSYGNAIDYNAATRRIAAAGISVRLVSVGDAGASAAAARDH